MRKRTPKQPQPRGLLHEHIERGVRPPPPPLIVSLDKMLRLASEALIETGGRGTRWLVTERALLYILHYLAFRREQDKKRATKQRGRS